MDSLEQIRAVSRFIIVAAGRLQMAASTRHGRFGSASASVVGRSRGRGACLRKFAKCLKNRGFSHLRNHQRLGVFAPESRISSASACLN